MARNKKRGHSPQDDDDVDAENRENGSHEGHRDDEYAEDDREDNNNRRKKKKRGGAPKIMGASGQTEADRRVLRRRQRDLHDDIAMGGNGADNDNAEREEDEDAGGAVDGLTRLRDQNNALWREVHYTREAVLDSENVDLIAGKAAREAEKLVQVPRYDAVRLAQSLVKKGSVRTGHGPHATSQFNWHGLGFQVGICFNAPPSDAYFLYGPLDAEYVPKERKKPAQRRKRTEVEEEMGEEEEPEDVDQTGKKKSDGNELSAVERHISVIRHALKERSEDQRESAVARMSDYEKECGEDDPTVLLRKKKEFVRESSQVDAVNCLFNPQSFTQTVENVFHFSFLVKEGRAGIRSRGVDTAEEFGLEGGPGPALRTVREGDVMPPPRQAIVSLNMRDWRDMCEAYGVEESDVPHRVDGKVAKKEKRARKSDS
mmetsp:Transcript_1417/g.3586  ORF Transcript_1417/g.3586 Transcript_1417/m.3586 type:complete len:429 (+) Transcript_1417:90-1376(+)